MSTIEQLRKEPHWSVLMLSVPRADDPPDTVVLRITNGGRCEVLWITADGQMHFNPNYTPSEQATAFRQAMNLAGVHTRSACVFKILPDAPATPEPPPSHPRATPEPPMTIHFREFLP